MAVTGMTILMGTEVVAGMEVVVKEVTVGHRVVAEVMEQVGMVESMGQGMEVGVMQVVALKGVAMEAGRTEVMQVGMEEVEVMEVAVVMDMGAEAAMGQV